MLNSSIINEHTLRVSEIFYSLQGESLRSGLPTVFVRLTGCPLRCGYCDSEYAFRGGESFEFKDIITQIADYKVRYVTVTGGEPLAQKNCLPFLSMLVDLGYEVSLETSGSILLSEVDARVMKVMDIKTPGSGEAEKNLYQNIQFLSNRDQIKMVICDRTDFDWAKNIIATLQLEQYCEILFSPSHEQLSPAILADWILSEHLNVRMQLQLHKYIWGDERGR